MRQTIHAGFFCAFTLLLGLPAFTDVSFHSPDINNANSVLFSVRVNPPGGHDYSTLFVKNLDSGTLEQLTVFPEAMEVLSEGRQLQIRNRFGTGRLDLSSLTYSHIRSLPSFGNDKIPSLGTLPLTCTSPNGKWMAVVEPVSAAFGKLYLHDTVTGKKQLLIESIERTHIPVSWSPDSSLFVYSVLGELYFARPEQIIAGNAVSLAWRKIGSGTIQNISWYASSRFMLVQGRNVYRIQTSELIARSLYSPLLSIGSVAGKIPAYFNGSTDRFCASPDGNSLILTQDKRNVFYCQLDGDDYVTVQNPSQLPWLQLPGSTAETFPFWTLEGVPVVFSQSVTDGKSLVKAWTLGVNSGIKIFEEASVPQGITSLAQSPDGSKIAFMTADGVYVYSTSTWKEIASFKSERPVSISWGMGADLFIGGIHTIFKVNVDTLASTIVLLSSAQSYSWGETDTEILCENPASRFMYSGGMKWAPTQKRMRVPQTANSRVRLYQDSSMYGWYANMIYVRQAVSPGGTQPIVREKNVRLDPLSSGTEKPFDGAVFSNGSRTRRREVALTFDVMDTIDGLPSVLALLEAYGIRATFFINGEFIRRHPAAVNEIVRSGHQCASLFFTTWNLLGSQYRIDEEFITRGLERNEDDFYDATGQELSLLWHAPYYVNSPQITDAGKKAGYTYVSPDVSVLDWVSRDQGNLMPGLYKSAAALIEDIITAKKPGSIIPVRIGRGEGERDDYLFEKLDILLNALAEGGYTIVTVDSLIQNAR